MSSWAIFYEGDVVFTSEDGEPYDAPRTGVMVIAEENDAVGYKLSHGLDYFYYEPERGGWATCDMFSAFDHLTRAKRQCLLFGRMQSDAEWRETFKRVKERLGPKQGWTATELRDGKPPA